ncbi:MAG TPA: hypothetical protein VF812_12520 [Ktedonobacterales bacterium]
MIATRASIEKAVTCPVCATTFAPRGNAGKCPVCGEQVVAPDALASNIPIVSPVSAWLFREGNWRTAAVAALVVYQIALFIALWIHLAQIHAF